MEKVTPNNDERLSLLRHALELVYKILNLTKPMTPKLELFCLSIQDHEGWYPGSRSYRNNSPGNLKYVGQLFATGKDKDGFAIFPDYLTGFEALKKMVLRAATGESKVYRPDMSIYEFFATYAPAADENNPKAYAEAVAKKVGILPTQSISSLIA